MAEEKLDLPEDLGLVMKPPSRDFAARGNDRDKVVMGFLDVSKDQAASENNIPFSPQWLYSKPTDSKIGISAGYGERPPNSLSHGTSPDSIQKDAWRLDGPQDKKEWRRNVSDGESARLWRDEERDTRLLGRRERRKEGDRENEYRKTDRRTDGISMREAADSRALSASDRWHEVTGRNSSHESRRDSKWPSRWGPEDKEKDNRTEKKSDAEKEDPHGDKQSLFCGNRLLSEPDSRDKWRPTRHRQEGYSGGSATHRPAPGFDRGRGQSLKGFNPGRGKPNFSDLAYSWPSAGSIGAASTPVAKNASSHMNTFRYPRGKLLDIYRRHALQSNFDTTPDCFTEVPPITQLSILVPLAFVKPDSIEESALDDIWEGKVVISYASYDSSSMSLTRVDNCEIDSQSHNRECKANVDASSNGMGLGGMKSTVARDDALHVMPGSLSHSEQKIGEKNLVGNDGCLLHPDFPKDAKSEGINSAESFDVTAKLPDDTNSLFDTSFIKEIPGSNIPHQNNDSEIQAVDQDTTELSLFYLDPQGETQGPFLIEDIISWYDQGFFGTDLLVCLSDALEGMPYRPLGEVMPELSLRPQFNPLVNPGEQSESSRTSRRNLEADASVSEFSSSFLKNDCQWPPCGPDVSFKNNAQSRIAEHNDSAGFACVELPPLSNPEIPRGLATDERQNFNIFFGHDTDDVLYMGKSSSSIHNSLERLSNDIHDLSRASSCRQILISETGQVDSGNQKVSTGNDMNLLGLSWSELEGTRHKGPLLSNIPGVGEQGHILNPLVGEASLFRHKQEDFSVKGDTALDAWSTNCRQNSSSNILQNVMDASHLERQVSGHFNLEQMLSQHFQDQQIQQQHLLSTQQSMHSSGSFLEQLQVPERHQQTMNQSISDIEHVLKLQFQQQRHLQQFEQQQQLHRQQQQQQLHHQMQLLQQQHQQQQNQLLIEQLLHEQMHDPGSGVSSIYPFHGEATLEEVLYRQRQLHELQQQAHHIPQNHDLSLDQFIQAKFGHNLHREHHNELLDALPHPSHRNMLPMDQEFLLSIQQEQLQARQFAIPSRQHSNMEEERHAGGVWSVDESGQFIRASASQHQANSSRLGQLDFIQPPQRPSSFNYPNHIERNLILHDQMQRGNYELNSQYFERSAGTPRPNKDLVSLLARLHGMDAQERHKQMNSSRQLGQFPSGSHTQQNWMPEKFPASHLDLMERKWLGPCGQQQNTLIESQFTQLLHAAEKQKRDMAPDIHMEDQTRWLGNDESSNHGLADLLHQKVALQSSQSLRLVNGAPTQSYENRDPSWFSRPSNDLSFSHVADNTSFGDSLENDPLFTRLGELPRDNLQEQTNAFEDFVRYDFQSSYGTPNEQNNFFSDMGEVERERPAVSMANDNARERIHLSDLKQGMRVKQHVSKGISVSRPILDSLAGEVEQEDSSILDHGALKVKGPVRHSSFGGTVGGASLYNYDMVADNAYVEEMVNDRVSGILSRGIDSSLLNRSLDPHMSSSQGTSLELAPVPSMKGKNPSTSAYSDEGRRDPGGNMAVQVSEAPFARKDIRFCRTSSYSGAEASEASFIDMLKGPRKPVVEADGSGAESTDAGKSSKKKGKKGRQIDPSLLGFKVHSNRILMGEIHRPDDS